MDIVIVCTESDSGNKADIRIVCGDFLEYLVEQVIGPVLLPVALCAVGKEVTQTADEYRNITKTGITAQSGDKALKPCTIGQTAFLGDITFALMPEHAHDL